MCLFEVPFEYFMVGKIVVEGLFGRVIGITTWNVDKTQCNQKKNRADQPLVASPLPALENEFNKDNDA